MDDPRPSIPDLPGVRGVFEKLYADLRRLAEYLVSAPGIHSPSVGGTDLAHEAFMKLLKEELRRRSEGRSELADKDGSQFRRFFATACREVLIDRARRRLAAKRGGGLLPGDLAEDSWIGPNQDSALLDLHDELRLLGEVRPEAELYVEKHLFGGMTREAIAEHFGVSVRAVSDELRFAWAWLRRRWEKYM